MNQTGVNQVAEEKKQKPIQNPEKPELEAHFDDKKVNNDDDNNEKIKNYKKQATRSFVLAFTTLIAIIAVCIAWFVSNTRVNTTGMSISAENSTRIELASVGERQQPEKNLLNLNKGTSTNEYTSYIDVETGNSVEASYKYHVGTSGIAWYLGKQETLSPGANGKLEFYIIAKQPGISSVDVTIGAEPYNKVGESSAAKSDDIILQNLVYGHILFFRQLKEEGYCGWISDGTFTVKAPTTLKSEFTVNVPYKVTVFWIWPRYFRNYIYDSREDHGDLFSDISQNGDAYANADYGKLLGFVKEQGNISNIEENKLFYNKVTNDSNKNTIDTTGIGDINSSMKQENFNLCSDYYNQADEYIGTNADYLYISAKLQ